MTTPINFRNVTTPITDSDVAIGFDPTNASGSAGRRSTWKVTLELLGLYIQFSTDNATWSDTATDDDTHFRIASGTTKPANSSNRWSVGIALGGGASTTSGTADPTGGDAGDAYLQVNTSDELTAVWLNISDTWTEYVVSGVTDDDRHLLDQVPGLVDKTQDLVVENEYTWADSSDGDIAFRLDAPPTPWLSSALWTSTYNIDAPDNGLNYLVFRIPIDADITEWQVERTRGAVVHEFHGSGFHRIHPSETGYKFYGNANVSHKTGDVFQVQKGTNTGEITEYLGHAGKAKFDAPDGTGNLADTVDEVHKLVTAIDELALGTGSDTAAQILTKLLTVDGAGSGLDADLLDGMTPAEIAAMAGGSYTLPQATESDLGGVQGASQSQAQSGSGSTILGWTNNRIRQLITAALPTVTNAQAIATSGTTRLSVDG